MYYCYRQTVRACNWRNFKVTYAAIEDRGNSGWIAGKSSVGNVYGEPIIGHATTAELPRIEGVPFYVADKSAIPTPEELTGILSLSINRDRPFLTGCTPFAVL
jgi:hypothetical protein